MSCLLSTGEPALRSLHDIWSTPVAFFIFILLTSLVIVSVFVGLKSKSMLFFGAFFLIRSMVGWLFSSKIIPLPISFATFIKKRIKIHLFYHLRLHHFPLKQFFADHLSIFLTKMV
jgi:cellulose synthase/poly-beta-1,6-N-acetylglucosamine synthase-like glycosyltransferase